MSNVCCLKLFLRGFTNNLLLIKKFYIQPSFIIPCFTNSNTLEVETLFTFVKHILCLDLRQSCMRTRMRENIFTLNPWFLFRIRLSWFLDLLYFVFVL